MTGYSEYDGLGKCSECRTAHSPNDPCPSSFSPPPWSAVEEDGKWSVVCDAYEDETPGICGNHSKAWPLFREDARLIAAAPDMLEALQAFVRDPQPTKAFLTMTGLDRQMFAKARAAIAKATGG